MPRLPAIDPAAATGRAKELFDGPLKGKHLNVFKSMAHGPAMIDGYLAMSGALGKASLSAREREIIALVVSQANGCEYCLAAHTAIGKGHGLTDEQCLDARKGAMPGDPKLDALVKFTTALHEKLGCVSQNDIDTLCKAGYNHGHVVETVATYGQSAMVNYFNNLNRTEVDLPAAPAL